MKDYQENSIHFLLKSDVGYTDVIVMSFDSIVVSVPKPEKVWYKTMLTTSHL